MKKYFALALLLILTALAGCSAQQHRQILPFHTIN